MKEDARKKFAIDNDSEIELIQKKQQFSGKI
jgi:hypothetical protein